MSYFFGPVETVISPETYEQYLITTATEIIAGCGADEYEDAARDESEAISPWTGAGHGWFNLYLFEYTNHTEEAQQVLLAEAGPHFGGYDFLHGPIYKAAEEAVRLDLLDAITAISAGNKYTLGDDV